MQQLRGWQGFMGLLLPHMHVKGECHAREAKLVVVVMHKRLCRHCG